jgi:hypothetical protein
MTAPQPIDLNGVASSIISRTNAPLYYEPQKASFAFSNTVNMFAATGAFRVSSFVNVMG